MSFSATTFDNLVNDYITKPGTRTPVSATLIGVTGIMSLKILYNYATNIFDCYILKEESNNEKELKK